VEAADLKNKMIDARIRDTYKLRCKKEKPAVETAGDLTIACYMNLF
jgi:hypothetical protein